MTEPMNIQDRVAARRAQLESQQREANLEREARERERAALEHAQRVEAVATLEMTLSEQGFKIRQDKGELVMEPAPLNIETTDVYRDQARKLLRAQARQLWTPSENKGVIATITTAIVSIFTVLIYSSFPIFTWILITLCIILAFSKWAETTTLDKRYLEKAREMYPVLANIADGD